MKVQKKYFFNIQFTIKLLNSYFLKIDIEHRGVGLDSRGTFVTLVLITFKETCLLKHLVEKYQTYTFVVLAWYKRHYQYLIMSITDALTRTMLFQDIISATLL